MQKDNRVLIGLVIFLSIIVLGLGGFIIYDKVLDNKEEKQTETYKQDDRDKNGNTTLEDQEAMIIGQMLHDKAIDAMGSEIGFNTKSVGWENDTCKDGKECYHILTNYDEYMDSIVSEKVKKAYEDANYNIKRVNNEVRYFSEVKWASNMAIMDDKLELVSKSSTQIKFKLLTRECNDYENYSKSGVCKDTDIKITNTYDFIIIKNNGKWIIDEMPVLESNMF